jgi:hypothetical protein
VLFWLFTQVYAGSEGFLPEEPKVTRLLEKLSLERGLLLGAAIGAAGLAGLITSLLYWNGQKFSHLNYEHSLRLMIPSVTALMVSCQVILGTFFLSILGIKHTRHPVTRSSLSVSERGAEGPTPQPAQTAPSAQTAQTARSAESSSLTSTDAINHREQPAAAPRL